MSNAETEDAGKSRQTRWLFLYLGAVFFLMAVGNLGLVSIMPAIGRMLDIPDYLIACVFSFSALAWAISSPFWATRVSRVGPNLYIRLGICGFVLSLAGFALGITLGRLEIAGPFGIFLLFSVMRIAFGLLGSGTSTAILSIVGLNTTGERRTRILTEIQGANNLGSVVGPAVAPLMIVAPLGFIGPILGFAVLGLVALATSFVFLKKQSPVPKVEQPTAPAATVSSVWKDKAVGPHLTFGMIVSSAQAINLYLIGFVLIDRAVVGTVQAQNLIATAMTGGAIAALIAQFGVVRIFPMPPVRMMMIGTALALAGNAWPLLQPSPFAAMGGFILASFGFGLARPGFGAAASHAGGRDDQVAIASAVSLIAGASIAVPPVLAAAAYQIFTPTPFAVPVAMLAYLLLSFTIRSRRQDTIVRREQ
ncbi:MFS transporter [Henriciella litoralis]|uniref:MFS transporter n=1 Tax=Henriciella litoralis TaxID=568102 RepID=UPI0009FEC357|nr:MFS transporter [Henriciella litoralis]